MSIPQNFRVASTLLLRGSLVYLGRRKGNGLWQGPGGKLEMGEAPRDGAQRELFEETGLHIPLERFVPLGMKDVPGHSYSIYGFSVVLDDSEVPRPAEPDKCGNWMLFSKEDVSRLRTVSFLPEFLGCVAA